MINHILNSNRKSYVTNETDYLLDFSRQINIHFKGIPNKKGAIKNKHQNCPLECNLSSIDKIKMDSCTHARLLFTFFLDW